MGGDGWKTHEGKNEWLPAPSVGYPGQDLSLRICNTLSASFLFLSLSPYPRPFKMGSEDSGYKMSLASFSQKWLGVNTPVKP